jgi:transposase
VKARVQHGEHVQALAVYVNQYHLVPLERTRMLLCDLLRVNVSTGSIVRWGEQAAQTLRAVEAQIKQALKNAPVKHKDETGAFALGENGKQHWFHVTCTRSWTHYSFHRARGREAVLAEGIMDGDTGIYVHDCQKTYFTFEKSRHALCGVHLLRELVFVHERTRQPWAQAMIWCLQEFRRIAQEARLAGKSEVDVDLRRQMRFLYVSLVRAGLRANPPPPLLPKPKRGRPKQSEARLLLLRLQKYRDAILLFLSDLRVPFDNNLAERDLRMIKLQQKISGCFRSEEGAIAFARLRGYLSTLRKQRLDLFEGIRQTMSGSPLLPSFQEGLC